MKNLFESSKVIAISFANFIASEGYKFGGNGKMKHEGYWVKFHGKGRGFKKLTTEKLYQEFVDYQNHLRGESYDQPTNP